MDTTFRHRALALSILKGSGCEVGAMNHPAPVPTDCRMDYVDIMDRAALLREFAEVPPATVHAPGFVGDIAATPLPAITGRTYDFAVCLHVLEHVANPIQALANLWAGVRDDGLLALAIPDRDHSFDRDRAETSWDHLREDFLSGVRDAADEHYADFVRHVHPEEAESPERFRAAVASARRHLEHVHVWTSASFLHFLPLALDLIGARAWPVLTLEAEATGFECFCLLQRGQPPRMAAVARCVLGAVYASRRDLQVAFPDTAGLPDWAKRIHPGDDIDEPLIRQVAAYL